MLGHFRGGIYVDLVELDVREFRFHCLELWPDHLAWRTPGSCEIDHYDAISSIGLSLVELFHISKVCWHVADCFLEVFNYIDELKNSFKYLHKNSGNF